MAAGKIILIYKSSGVLAGSCIISAVILGGFVMFHPLHDCSNNYTFQPSHKCSVWEHLVV
jgi:hypothetical protein